MALIAAAAEGHVADEMRVQGEIQPVAKKPGVRGSKQCWCQGEFLMMVGHYGWIMSLDCIDHPDAGKHDGDIYVSKRDLGGHSLKKGDRVGFFLYADEQGLGAEECILIQEAIDDANDQPLCEISSQYGCFPEGFTFINSVQGDCWGDVSPHEGWTCNEYCTPTLIVEGELMECSHVVSLADMNPYAAEYVPVSFRSTPQALEFTPCQSIDHPQLLSKEDCASTSEGEDAGLMSSDCSSDSDADSLQAQIGPPPGLTLPPWRRGMGKTPSVAMPANGDALDHSTKRSAPPWRRSVKGVSFEASAGTEPQEVSILSQALPGLDTDVERSSLQAPPGLTVAPWRCGGGMKLGRIAASTRVTASDELNMSSCDYTPPWRRAVADSYIAA